MLKKTFLIGMLAISATILTACQQSNARQAVKTGSSFANVSENTPVNHSAKTTAHTTQNLVIFYDANTGAEPLLQEIEKGGFTLVYHYPKLHGVVVGLADKMPLEQAISHFKQVQGVRKVSRDDVISLH